MDEVIKRALKIWVRTAPPPTDGRERLLEAVQHPVSSPRNWRSFVWMILRFTQRKTPNPSQQTLTEAFALARARSLSLGAGSLGMI